MLMQYKLAEFYNAKRIRSISLPSFSRKKKMTSSDITSPCNRTVQMKEGEVNYTSVKFHGRYLGWFRIERGFFPPEFGLIKAEFRKNQESS